MCQYKMCRTAFIIVCTVHIIYIYLLLYNYIYNYIYNNVLKYVYCDKCKNINVMMKKNI